MNPFKYGGVVDGEFFCPRPDLERSLASYIKSGQNVVIQGERRTGKTSLVLETVRNLKGFALFHADFLGVRDLTDFCNRLASAFARLEYTDSWLAKLVRSLTQLRPVVSIDPSSGAPTVSLDARLAETPDSLDAILTALIEQTARRKVCVVLDEFQDILDIEDGERILAIMRSRIQLDSRTAYIFLGSVQNRMTDIFFKYKSPFYHSATSFPVGEIEYDRFLAFTKKRFATAKRTLPQDVFDAAYRITSRNPGYTQELCEAIWQTTASGDILTEKNIPLALSLIYAREQDHYVFCIKQLTSLQKRMLKMIAIQEGREVFSAKSLEVANVYNRTSAKKAVAKLEKEDLIYWYRNAYRFVNPFFREWVKRL